MVLLAGILKEERRAVYWWKCNAFSPVSSCIRFCLSFFTLFVLIQTCVSTGSCLLTFPPDLSLAFWPACTQCLAFLQISRQKVSGLSIQMLICLKWSSSTYLPKSFLSLSLKSSYVFSYHLQDCNNQKEVFLLFSLAMPKLGCFLLYTSFGNTHRASFWTTTKIAFPSQLIQSLPLQLF